MISVDGFAELLICEKLRARSLNHQISERPLLVLFNLILWKGGVANDISEDVDDLIEIVGEPANCHSACH